MKIEKYTQNVKMKTTLKTSEDSVLDPLLSELYDSEGSLAVHSAENYATTRHTDKINDLVKKLVVS